MKYLLRRLLVIFIRSLGLIVIPKMQLKTTTVFTFKIKSTFNKWVAFFDSEDSFKRLSEFEIKPLYRGHSKKDPQKVIVIHQCPEGNMQKFFQKHGSWLATHGVKVSTVEVSDW